MMKRSAQLRFLRAQCALRPGEIGADLFAGGGGWSEGFMWATGVPPAVAVDHDEDAIEMHTANHPETEHHREDIFEVDPVEATRGRPVGWLHLSPDCTHFSRAKGTAPKSHKIRALATVAIPWAKKVSPRIISLENVAEFLTWGPLRNGQPIKSRSGETFKKWVGELEALGYEIQWRVLNAADFGAPTSRKRLFLIARRDGLPIVWPEPTHGKGLLPYRTAAECIDWSIPVPSIFGRKKSLAEATERRIAEGIRRYVLQSPRPFIVNLTHGVRIESLDEPFRTITAAHRSGRTEAPLVSAFLAKHYGGVVGQPMDQQLGTITAKDHHSLVAVIVGAGDSAAKYYGNDKHGQDIETPMHSIRTHDGFGFVTVTIDGEEFAIVDIGMRMLQPRELARAQGFPDDYVLTGTKSQQVARIGNSVCPQVAEAIVTANLEIKQRSQHTLYA